MDQKTFQRSETKTVVLYRYHCEYALFKIRFRFLEPLLEPLIKFCNIFFLDVPPYEHFHAFEDSILIIVDDVESKRNDGDFGGNDFRSKKSKRNPR